MTDQPLSIGFLGSSSDLKDFSGEWLPEVEVVRPAIIMRLWLHLKQP